MYNLVAIAGTFDRLHKGHQYFISRAFGLGRKVVIGLTSDHYVKENSKFKIQNSKLQFKIKNYLDRKRELEKYLKEMGYQNRAKIVKIDDVYGPTLRKTDTEALVVTKESKPGAIKVNKRRGELLLPSLKIIEVPLVDADDDKIISSSRIRLGEIDRWGKVFRRLKITSPISEEFRRILKKPLGDLLAGNSIDLEMVIPSLKKRLLEADPVILITVGDEVTKIANKSGFKPDLAVIDFLVNRIKKYSDIKELYYDSLDTKVMTVKNLPGNITFRLINAVGRAISKTVRDGRKRLILVDGEEDLAGVPAILLAPLGSAVIYGQPAFVPIKSGLRRGEARLHTDYMGLRRSKTGGGIVVVEVTEEKKRELMELLTENN